MYGWARIFGIIGVEQRNKNEVWITGIPADVIKEDIAKIYRTDKINAFMFTTLGRNYIVFAPFFLPDFLFILQGLKDDASSYTSKRVLEKIIDGLMTNTWLKDTIRDDFRGLLDFTQLNKFKWSPLPHQAAFFKLYNKDLLRYHLNGYLLASSPGSGKSYMGIAVALCLKAPATFIISPRNAVDLVWAESLSDQKGALLKQPESYWTSTSGELLELGKKFYIFHYEALDRALLFIEKFKEKEVFINIDETHNFNELTARRTLDLIKLCSHKNISWQIWATGTPIKALGAEIIPLLRSIDPLFDEDAETRFRRIYGRDVNKATEILSHRIGLVSYKVPKSLFRKNKEPTVIKKYVKVPDGHKYTLKCIKKEMSDFIAMRLQHYKDNIKLHNRIYNDTLNWFNDRIKTRIDKTAFDRYVAYMRQMAGNYDSKEHKEMMAYCRNYEKRVLLPKLPSEMRKAYKNSKSVVMYVRLKVQGEALGRILGKRRAEIAAQLSLYCELDMIVKKAKAKTLVFSSYTEGVHVSAKYLTSKGFMPVKIYADTNKDLFKLIEEFKTNKDLNPVCTTFKSLSTAVPMIMANTIVMLNVPYRHYEYEQTVARIDRIGQLLDTFVYEIYLDTGKEENISTRMGEIIEWSRDQIEALLGSDFSSISPNVMIEHFASPDISDQRKTGLLGIVRRWFGLSKDY
jgi:superfamily II DNA or RNA helicase